MKKKRLYQKLLRQMPRIAKTVNRFESEVIAEQAFRELVEALKQSESSKKMTANSDNTNGASNGDSKPATPSVADMLAAARAEKGGSGAASPKPAAKKDKPSDVEGFKETSEYLKGDIPDELVDGEDHFGKGSVQLLKHHGTYQQDNRDIRSRGGSGKSVKHFIFMVRTKIPGGIFTSEQLASELDLCDEFGDGTLRITSRQGLQLHGIPKNDLKATIAKINAVGASTLGACGDVNRNVMACPAPIKDDVHAEMQKLADDLAEHFAPRTTSYREIWLKDTETDEKEMIGGGPGEVIEPIYGTHYLPRKFKIGVALPEDNCIDLYTHDLGFLAVVRDGKVIGYNVLVGGGQGRTPSNKKTFPALGKRMAFVPADRAIDAATAVVKVQRDFGNRSDRKVARMKYLIHNWGLEKFRAKVEEYYGEKMADCEPDEVTGFDDHMGWHEQGDGNWFYGLNVENGRIKDEGEFQLKTALREICSRFKPGIRFTAHQDILFCDLPESAKSELESVLKEHGIALSHEVSTVRRWSMACVAWPTCGLSITESERALPGMIDQMEADLAKLGLSKEEFTVRMTGCPNGCARPYNSDIGLVGRSQGAYTIFLGGRLVGNRLNWEYKDRVPSEEVAPELAKVFAYFKADRENGETLGDFCERKGKEDIATWAAQ